MQINHLTNWEAAGDLTEPIYNNFWMSKLTIDVDATSLDVKSASQRRKER